MSAIMSSTFSGSVTATVNPGRSFGLASLPKARFPSSAVSGRYVTRSASHVSRRLCHTRSRYFRSRIVTAPCRRWRSRKPFGSIVPGAAARRQRLAAISRRSVPGTTALR